MSTAQILRLIRPKVAPRYASCVAEEFVNAWTAPLRIWAKAVDTYRWSLKAWGL